MVGVDLGSEMVLGEVPHLVLCILGGGGAPGSPQPVWGCSWQLLKEPLPLLKLGFLFIEP